MAEILKFSSSTQRHLVPVLLAGGAGTRLFPLSTPEKPKQFLCLRSNQSLFQDTLARIMHAPASLHVLPPVIVTHARYADLVDAQCTALGIRDTTLLLEPEARNTAAAIALAAEHIRRCHPNALMLVLPTDHAIDDAPAFYEALVHGISAAQTQKLVTFGVVPDHAATGYGYIEKGKADPESTVYPIARFVEKPCLQQAEEFVQSGNWLWNAGIFLMPAALALSEGVAHAPSLAAPVARAYANASVRKNCILADARAYAAAPALPFDKAVMENTSHGVVVPVACQWNDLGSWDALYALAEQDNARDTPLSVLRPWGSFAVLRQTPDYCLKELRLNSHAATSLQQHHYRAEHWRVIRGVATVVCGEQRLNLMPGDSVDIPRKAIHRLENNGHEPLVVMEVQIGTHLCEDDIVRLDDRYGRVLSHAV